MLLGIRINLKYMKHKQAEFFLVGSGWIIFASLWVSFSLNFLMVILIGTNLNIIIYISIMFITIPIAFTCWIIAISKLFEIKLKSRKLIVVLSIFLNIILGFLYIFFLLTDLSLIGYYNSLLNVSYGFFSLIYFLTYLIIFSITCFFFSFKCFISESQDIRLKGKFIFIAILIFLIGGIFTIITQNVFIDFLGRIFVFLSSLLFYVGFVLPEGIKKKFLKEEE